MALFSKAEAFLSNLSMKAILTSSSGKLIAGYDIIFWKLGIRLAFLIWSFLFSSMSMSLKSISKSTLWSGYSASNGFLKIYGSFSSLSSFGKSWFRKLYLAPLGSIVLLPSSPSYSYWLSIFIEFSGPLINAAGISKTLAPTCSGFSGSSTTASSSSRPRACVGTF